MHFTSDEESSEAVIAKPSDARICEEELDGQTEILISWDSPTDPHNPHNWASHRKWSMTLLVSFGSLVTLMSGSVLAPAIPVMSKDLRITVSEAQLALSIFVLAFSVGPIVLAPLSEIYGRRPIWLYGGIWYLIWNTVCGFADNKTVIIVGRLFAGLGAAGEYSVCQPILSDVWKPEERGKAYAISTFLPLLGPALGPILGGVMTDKLGWPWLFFVISIFDGTLIIYALIMFHEPYGPQILSQKAKAMNKQGDQKYTTEHDRAAPTISQQLSMGLSRPARLLATQPILQLMSLYLAYNFGILYIVLSTFATLWTERYHQPVSVSGLHYLALVIGYTIAAQVGGKVTDRVWAHLQKKAEGHAVPEYRVPLMIPGAVLIPIGLFWYGWAAEARILWIVPDIGIMVFGCGIILGTQAMQAYVLDSYPRYTASAVAGAQLPRGFAAFAFPIFAPKMYSTLGYGWGNGLLAFTFMAIGIPAPILLWKFGAQLRARGKPQW
ncbi:hypothetical protein BP6252_06121 [Coleophoma cylindrospora]|uniref:Major facilitator superfamily (MFS) profile domain-containing protein n=1 Tax=Coleophoma cylindrospora TaxID=1849047 RepID=A0A3D8RLR6_9HELO|nr:hypothetical protein BP6252_06121 [Coleophoma cylindrospora]